MFASNSGTEVGVVSNGELDGDDNSPVMAKTVQVGAEWAADEIVLVRGKKATSQSARKNIFLRFSLTLMFGLRSW